MTTIFSDIALVLALATIFGAIFSRLKQPLVLAYLVVGILAASSGFLKNIGQTNELNFLSELGIAFALFLIGLELRFSDIKQIGRAATWLGIGQVVVTTALGFVIAHSLLGLAVVDSFFLSLALSFSSTLIVVQLLGQKRDLDSLYGKITTGYLIIQDFLAILTLVFLASFSRGSSANEFMFTLGEGIALIVVIMVLNKYVLQGLFDLLAKNPEVLFLSSISWALVFTAISVSLGFSIEIGAFLAGLGLASLREEQQIASWIRPLRDFFVTLFFLSLGLKLPIASLLAILGPVFLLSLFVLIGNPLVMLIIMRFLGFRARTSFHVSVTSAQVSEFSFIMIALAGRLGLASQKSVNLVAATAFLTIVVSTYLIINSSKIYKLLIPVLKIFEQKNPQEKPFISDKEFSDHVVLVGVGRLGWDILDGLLKKNFSVVVVDFNPKVVKLVEKMGIDVLYGDIGDPDIFNKAVGRNPKMLISTVFDKNDTLDLLNEVKNTHHKIPLVATSPDISGALEFYKKGASYVIVPRILSSHLIKEFIMSNKFEELGDGSLRKEEIEELAKHEDFL